MIINDKIYLMSDFEYWASKIPALEWIELYYDDGETIKLEPPSKVKEKKGDKK